MADEPQLIYLEPDDEITSVVRRVRAAEGRSVVIVAPGRSRATSSSVALRLLAQVAAEEKRGLALVADPATRAVAAEAGIAAYASVAEATSGKAAREPAGATPRAPIHVVRGVADIAPAAAVELTPRADLPGPSDETVVVRIPKKTPTGGAGKAGAGGTRLPRWPWLAAPLLVLLVIGAALLPAATVHITPASVAVQPRSYQLNLPTAGHQSSNLQATAPGTATGVRLEEIPATGSVTLYNWNFTTAVAIPQGSSVSVGGQIAFATNERLVVSAATLNGNTVVPSHGNVGVTAIVPGPTGNVAADAIDTVDDRSTMSLLRGSPSNKNRLVDNPDATSGGAEVTHPVIQQLDIDAVVTALQTDLAAQLTDSLAGQTDRLYAGPPADEAPVIVVPPELVGTEDVPTFELDGTLAVDRPYVVRHDVQVAATETLVADPTATPAGTSILPDSIEVEIGAATATADEMTVEVVVRAAAATTIDESAVRDQVAGLTVEEAQAELADIGAVEVDLWPGWLDRLPRLAFRISVDTTAASPQASASP